ncbi:PEP-CTERM sorting domain-containing protein [Chamaesiphon minutus]|uniref:PEP-CTERM putative exosortase interaction domain-containing protein n=1 Tax=Chamaesiphon minutus (strain ATCC 27169 / PCC 6605) TaxID=1173020 RepID=K9UNG1_CHAP6|nr:PEP-CTERM sorting domain-containing protein [Chamaesiphon minutus]AFY96642.1 PEP-CTERM putative exosortase interaction domain-containing protein [Chamaesiphon minutus PCC 6605]
MKHSICSTKIAKVFIPVGCVAVSALVVAPAQAANFAFTENPDNTLSITADFFESGFSVNGNLLQQGGTPGTLTLPGSNNPVSFSGTWLNFNQSTPLSRTIYFTDGNTSQISDIFSYTVSNANNFGTISGTFQSASNLGFLPNGVSQSDVFQAGTSVPFSSDFLTASVATTAPTSVPEPFTIIGTLIGGTAAFRMKKKLNTTNK